jgi:sugar phosphate isomerase/epimerase
LNIKLFKALWGMESLSLEEQFARIASAGCYTGIESPLPSKEKENQFRELLSKYQFDYIAMVFTEGEDHLASFQRQLEQAAAFNPLFINAHSAKDSMPYDKQLAFYEQALRAEKAINIQVGHETHRGRAMFTPWGTARLLKDLPDLKITADFSHWCCACESLLEDQADNLKLAFERTIHIHSRVG